MPSSSNARERALVRGLLKKLKERGYWRRKISGSPYLAGLPDVLVLVKGRAVWLEAKRPGEAPTKLQLETIGELRRAGAVAEVVESADEGLRIVEHVRFLADEGARA